ncbi:MAG: phosphorylase [Halobacteriales archaeon]
MTVSLDALVLPAFDTLEDLPSEVAPWRDRYDLEGRVRVPGVATALAHGGGVGVVPTGVGKVAAATTTASLLAADAVDLDDAVVCSVGIAGGPPSRVRLGSVVVADAVVDWDLKLRAAPARAGRAIAPNPYVPDAATVTLDASGVDRTMARVEGIELSAPADVDGARDGPDLGTDERPRVRRGTNLCGDELWHGPRIGAEADWLVERHGLGPYLVTEMEDVGTARALERFGRLEDYRSIRGVANFDRPVPGAPDASLEAQVGAGAAVAIENAVSVAAAVVEARRCAG